MKYAIYAFLVFTLLSCTKDILREELNNSDKDNVSDSNGSVNEALFDVINLEYPGLEEVKVLYEANLYDEAAEALLEYYRMRTGITNTAISLINVTVSSDDQNRAAYALDGYRFHVSSYFENADTRMPYSLNQDGQINWLFEPEGADNEYQNQLHRHQWFVSQAKMYRVSKDEKHIQSWIAVYRDWWENNPMPETGPNNTSWQQRQVAARVLDQTKLFDYYKHSVHFTPEWFSEFMVYFARHADFLEMYPFHRISQGSALTFAAVLFPEFKNASLWKNTGFQTLDAEIKEQFLEDGMHYHLDFSYHISAIADYYEVMKLAEANPDVVGTEASDFKQYLRKAVAIVRHFAFPNYFTGSTNDYFVPGFNDTRQASWTRGVLNANFRRHTEMFPEDSEIRYMATYGQSGTQPSTAPVAVTPSGTYVLRNGWDWLSTMFIMTNNYTEVTPPFPVTSHNQPDNGTFELYHKGRNFFPDAGVYAYAGGDNIERSWYRQTRVHNTLTLNGNNIIAGKGRSLLVTTEGETDIIATENQGYGNLKHRRYVFFVNKTFFVLVDEAIGNASGTVNLNFNLCEGDSEVIVSADQHGAHTAFSDDNNMIFRSFGNKSLNTIPFQSKVSYVRMVESGRKAYAVNMEKSAGEVVRYITVLYPDAQAGSVQINAGFNTPFSETGVDLDVEIDGTSYHLRCNL